MTPDEKLTALEEEIKALKEMLAALDKELHATQKETGLIITATREIARAVVSLLKRSADNMYQEHSDRIIDQFLDELEDSR